MCQKQSTPRKGTNTSMPRIRISAIAKQSTPRKGTNTHPLAYPEPEQNETIYTPQGDEYRKRSCSWKLLLRNNLHPARGRIPHLVPVKDLVDRETIYTPQGDEYLSFHFRLSPAETKQSTPRKGTENIYYKVCFFKNLHDLHPVKERIQPGFSVVFRQKGNDLPPARGRILRIRLVSECSDLKQSTPRKGTNTEVG